MIPIVSGAEPGAGHYAEFMQNPARFMLRAWQECGELAEFDLGGVRNVLMVGPAAHEAVFRAGFTACRPHVPSIKARSKSSAARLGST